MRKMWTGLVALAPSLMACGGPQYHYVSQADPSTFARPGCHVLLEPVHAEGLMIGDESEAQYVADKGPGPAASYAKDKSDSVLLFQQTMAELHPAAFAPGGSPDNTFVIRPVWTHWVPGFYAAIP